MERKLCLFCFSFVLRSIHGLPLMKQSACHLWLKACALPVAISGRKHCGTLHNCFHQETKHCLHAWPSTSSNYTFILRPLKNVRGVYSGAPWAPYVQPPTPAFQACTDAAAVKNGVAFLLLSLQASQKMYGCLPSRPASAWPVCFPPPQTRLSFHLQRRCRSRT